MLGTRVLDFDFGFIHTFGSEFLSTEAKVSSIVFDSSRLSTKTEKIELERLLMRTYVCYQFKTEELKAYDKTWDNHWRAYMGIGSDGRKPKYEKVGKVFNKYP